MEVESVRLLEVVKDGDNYVASGREIVLPSDCPLFFLPDWGAALEKGVCSIPTAMFDQIAAIVKELSGDGS